MPGPSIQAKPATGPVIAGAAAADVPAAIMASGLANAASRATERSLMGSPPAYVSQTSVEETRWT